MTKEEMKKRIQELEEELDRQDNNPNFNKVPVMKELEKLRKKVEKMEKKTYKTKDIEKMQSLFQQAAQIVEETIVKNNIRDSGTCVLDAGIKVKFVPPRCRNAVDYRVVSQPFQGNISNYNALKPALEFLRSKGVECFYDDGRTD